jgi:hypothetical protein
MVTDGENTSEVVEVVTSEVTPETITTEVSAREPAKSAREIELEKEIEKWQNEAKSHQRTASKKAEEAQKWQSEITSINSKLEENNTRIDTFAEYLESRLLDQTNSDDYGEQPKQRKPTYKELISTKIKPAKTPAQIAQEQHLQEVSEEILTIQKELEVDFKESDDPEQERVYTQFMNGNIDKALKLAKGVRDKMVEAKAESKDNPLVKQVKELQAELARMKKIESGELNSDKGLPTGSGLTYEAIKKMTPDQKVKNNKAITAFFDSR